MFFFHSDEAEGNNEKKRKDYKDREEKKTVDIKQK